MHPTYTHIVDYIRNVAQEISAAATASIRGIVNKLRKSHVTFTGGVTSPKVTVDDTEADVNIPLTVDPTKHSHTANQFKNGVDPEPDTIVKRDNKGNIFSSGTDYNNTGYKLANNNDLATLFTPKNNTVMTVEYTNKGKGNALLDLKIEKVGTVFKVTRTYGNVCNCYT